jgi:two-component system, LytTR family, response regulator
LSQLIKTLIVDDERLARDALRVLLGDDPDIEIVGECRNGREAIMMIQEHTPDLVFLDVQMPDADGFQVLERIDQSRLPVIVFVTAYDTYALRAFKSHALDYILKPFDHERFEAALQRAKHQVQLHAYEEIGQRLVNLLSDLRSSQKTPRADGRGKPFTAKYLRRLTVRSGKRVLVLKAEELDWIEASGDYMNLHAGGRSFLLRETMNGLAAKLDPETFLRINRSTIINVERIRDMQPLFKGDSVVTLKDGTELKLNRNYRHKLEALVGGTL